MSNLGRFIVVEGLEGAGKSTAVETIKEFFSTYHQHFITTREPGGTRVGEAVRHLIKQVSSESESLEAKAELLLLYASRVQLVEQVIKPALNDGTWVLADRFELSTFAYQGGGRGLDVNMISELSQYCLNGFSPDLIIFMDITPELGLSRALKRGSADRIEQESLDFFYRVYDAYHETIKTMKQVVVIDATQTEQVVKQNILDALLNYFQGQKP